VSATHPNATEHDRQRHDERHRGVVVRRRCVVEEHQHPDRQADEPAHHVSAPCDVTCASITSSTTPSRISASPAHEIGSTEKPKSAVRSAIAAERPRQHDSGMEDLEADPRDTGEEEEPEDVSGRSRVLRSRVKKPGFRRVDGRPREMERVRALRILRAIAVELPQERWAGSAPRCRSRSSSAPALP